MITPGDGQLILLTCRYIPAMASGPSNLWPSPYTVRCTALFQSSGSHGNFFGEIFLIALSTYKVNPQNYLISHHQSRFEWVRTYVPRLELQTEPAPEERTRTGMRLNLRFSSGVWGLNRGSGPNFGIPNVYIDVVEHSVQVPPRFLWKL